MILILILQTTSTFNLHFDVEVTLPVDKVDSNDVIHIFFVLFVKTQLQSETQIVSILRILHDTFSQEMCVMFSYISLIYTRV